MKRYLYTLVVLWAMLIALMCLQKPIFMLFEPGYDGLLSETLVVMWHGLSMDIAMSSYLVAPILLWLIARIWIDKKWMICVLSVWLWIVGAVLAISSVLDAVLFPYWGCRLDTTPLFYFITSPSAAFASLSWWVNLIILLAIAIFTCGLGCILNWMASQYVPKGTLQPLKRRIVATVVAVCVAASMIIPIRGGFTVSTMSPGRAFFSNNMALNNAAINPLFNFMYSLSHSDNLKEQFRFFSDAEATNIVKGMYTPQVCVTASDSVWDENCKVDIITAKKYSYPKLAVERPNVYLIILESFSSHLLPVQGGENIASGLDMLAREGILFTRFYAESFRTDRAIPAIISGYPAQPTTSMLRFLNKFENIPSLATVLKPLGYTSAYYYGGDIAFTNLGAYLVASGFENIISDKDFAIGKRMSKWGAHDAEVYSRLLEDIASRPVGNQAYFTVIQTSSSHEPFEVPYDKFANKQINAFAYADKCLIDFTDALKASGEWSRSLVVVVPDHWGCYPENLKDYESRHHIPLVITGGAIDSRGIQIDRLGSQSAIAATIATLLGADIESLHLSRNLLDDRLPEWAWMCEPGWFGLRTPDGLTIVDVASSNKLKSSANSTDDKKAKAFVQKLYDDLDAR